MLASSLQVDEDKSCFLSTSLWANEVLLVSSLRADEDKFCFLLTSLRADEVLLPSSLRADDLSLPARAGSPNCSVDARQNVCLRLTAIIARLTTIILSCSSVGESDNLPCTSFLPSARSVSSAPWYHPPDTKGIFFVAFGVISFSRRTGSPNCPSDLR